MMIPAHPVPPYLPSPLLLAAPIIPHHPGQASIHLVAVAAYVMSCHASASSVTPLLLLPPPTQEGPLHRHFGNCFSAVLQFPNILFVFFATYRVRPRVRPSVGMKRNRGFGNWRDDGRAVSRICHSLVGPSLRQTGGQPGIPRACCRRRRCTRWWFFSHSRITTRLSNVYSAELGDFLGSSSQCRLRIHCRVCGGVRLLAATN